MLDVARSMLAGDHELIEGCRRIARLGSLIDAEDDPAVIPFRGFASETDHFPQSDARSNFAPEFLGELDREAEAYVQEARTEILRSCGYLLARFEE